MYNYTIAEYMAYNVFMAACMFFVPFLINTEYGQSIKATTILPQCTAGFFQKGRAPALQVDRAKVKNFTLSAPVPNPATVSCQFNIEWYNDKAKKAATLIIYDLNGNKIADITHLLTSISSGGSSTIEVNVATINSGVYIVLLSLAGIDTASSKLVILK